jgi:hypothetical protein
MIFTTKRVALVTTVLVVLVGGYLWLLGSEHPPLAFDKTVPPPAPDYARSQDWLAFPGRNTTQVGRRGAERLIHDTNYWWRGAWKATGLPPADVSPFKRGYGSLLRVVYGSFHVLDYGLFYENIRQNALQRTRAWQESAAK